MFTKLTSKDLRPTDSAPVFWNNTFSILKWGIPSPWDGKPLINARSETLEQKQNFRPLLTKRCLVPANGSYEWRRDGNQKVKNSIGKEDRSIFSFAGLTDGTYFTILTSVPISSVEHIHSRMPVILTDDGKRAWIDTIITFASAASYLKSNKILTLIARENVLPQPRQGDLFLA